MKRIGGIFVCTLLLTTLLPMSVLAGDETNPEITDATRDARMNVDIKKAWFFEDPAAPDYLYITIQVGALVPKYRGTLLNDVGWTMNNVNYYVAGCLGIYLSGVLHQLYVAVGIARTRIFTEITGSMDVINGTITCKIPKSLIGDPHTGDVLTQTYASTSQRTPIMEWIGWDAYIWTKLFRTIGLPSMCWIDRGPDSAYGTDYSIQY
jgi:hypothetical protein